MFLKPKTVCRNLRLSQGTKLLDVNYLKFHYNHAMVIREGEVVKKKLISRDCDGCEMQKTCIKRFSKVSLGEKVYCPDGARHLVDNASQVQ